MDKEDKAVMDEYDEGLKGTFVSVIVIGIIILATWFAMLYFYTFLLDYTIS